MLDFLPIMGTFPKDGPRWWPPLNAPAAPDCGFGRVSHWRTRLVPSYRRCASSAPAVGLGIGIRAAEAALELGEVEQVDVGAQVHVQVVAFDGYGCSRAGVAG